MLNNFFTSKGNSTGLVITADNLLLLNKLADNCIDMIYIDPPFNILRKQQRSRISVKMDALGDRTGFGDKKYLTTKIDNKMSFGDNYADYLGFLRPRLQECFRVLKDTGNLYIHLDYREVHYVKVMLDEIFGRENFINEIIWLFDYGARSKTRWPAKHNNILLYAKNCKKFYFDYSSMERVPYLAPDLVGKEKALKGKTLTDSFFLTIVPTNGKEKTGYPTQKPEKLLTRLIKVSCPEHGIVLDFCAGLGTSGASALLNNRRFILVDSNPQAIDTIKKRLGQNNIGYLRM